MYFIYREHSDTCDTDGQSDKNPNGYIAYL